MWMVLYLFIITEGALADGASCHDVAENLATADRNIAWVCEQLNWRNALAEWKKRAERDCNISDAEEYWREAFSCLDFTAITCVNNDARRDETDVFNCSISYCNDGLYSDQLVFLDIWRQYLNTHTTIMAIYVNKLIDCICEARECLNSDAVTLEAWNSQSLKYSELSIALLEEGGKINRLESKSEVCDALSQNYTELSKDVLEARELIENLNNQSEAHGERYSELSSAMTKANEQIQNNSDEWNSQSQKYSDLSKAMLEVNKQIQALGNKSEAWDAVNQKYLDLSNAILVANDQIQELQNKSEERYSTFSSAMTKAYERIDQLQNNSEIMDTKEQVEQLRNITTVLDEQFTKYSNLLAEANEKISNLENKTDSCPMRHNGKCFWIECREPSITIEEGRAICSAEGGRLADIYSSNHYYMLLRYLRMFVNYAANTAWIAMTYDVQTNTVSLSDGTPAPFVKWYPGYPISSHTSNIHLNAHTDSENVYQHLVNTHSSWGSYGAICEK